MKTFLQAILFLILIAFLIAFVIDNVTIIERHNQRVKQPPIMVYIEYNEYWQYPFGEVEIYDPSENSPYPGAIPE